MDATSGDSRQPSVIGLDGLESLLDALAAHGRRVVGPTVRDQAIVYAPIERVADLPVGWTDKQDAGKYRLERRQDAAVFGYALGPQSWKQFLYPGHLGLWHATYDGDGPKVISEADEPQPLALIGVRACELSAIKVQDRVLLGGQFADPHYRTRRQRVFIVAVNCTSAGGTCFCVSMNTGPRVEAGFDLLLTELIDDSNHVFLIESGSEEGRVLLAELPTRAATPEHLAAAESAIAQAAASMGRELAAEDIHDVLLRNLEHPRWDHVANRCLACTNCTMVCPTCFCTTVEHASDLTGNLTSASRRWDSCFTLDFAFIHGGSVRSSRRARYRQWLTHKLATWIDQFGTSGCVGCGRCITWCPVGIDLTEEVEAIRANGSS
jgi:ferredoxin